MIWFVLLAAVVAFGVWVFKAGEREFFVLAQPEVDARFGGDRSAFWAYYDAVGLPEPVRAQRRAEFNDRYRKHSE